MTHHDRRYERNARTDPRSGALSCGIAATAVALIGWWGCGPADSSADNPTLASEEVVAQLEPTRDSQVQGTVTFFEDGDQEGLRIRADVSGLEPGRHGFHVHRNGDCSAPDASSAGPHFAFVVDGTESDRITGNLGELEADSSGHAVLETVVPTAELEGERGILGRAVVVHARGNDPRVTPTGDAGARVACGVIIASRADRL